MNRLPRPEDVLAHRPPFLFVDEVVVPQAARPSNPINSARLT